MKHDATHGLLAHRSDHGSADGAIVLASADSGKAGAAIIARHVDLGEDVPASIRI